MTRQATDLSRRRLLQAAPLALLAGCNRSTRMQIGVVPKGTSSIFWQSVRAGVDAAATKLDVDALWNGPPQETEFARQIQIVESMINRRVDGIVLSPTESTSLVGVVEQAMSQDIPVVIFDSAIATDNYVSFIATNNEEAGALAADTLSELIGGEGPIAVVKHVPGSASTTDRERGFENALATKHKGIEIAASDFCMSDRAKALQISEDMITGNPGLKAIFATSEAAAVGAARAVEGRDMKGKLRLVGFDASPSLQQDLRDGIIDALVVQDPYQIGYLGVEVIVRKLRGEEVEHTIYSPARVVTAAELDSPEVQKLLNPLDPAA